MSHGIRVAKERIIIEGEVVLMSAIMFLKDNKVKDRSIVI